MSDINHLPTKMYTNGVNGLSTSSECKTNHGPMYIHTPLIASESLAKTAKCGAVYMKLENTQPSGSFKLRGISNMVLKELGRGCSRMVASSGGNAGLAAAYTTRRLGIPLTLYIPSATKPQMREKLIAEGANVIVHGNVWDEADAKAREEAKQPGVGYIPPFDHPDVWEGHESMILEAADQLKDKGGRPDLVVVSVGGGGLMIGVSQGMVRVGWESVPILTVETIGADCFNQAVKAGHPVTLPAITSIATTLGALTVAGEAMRLYKERPIISEVITDKQCVEAICQFLDDHRILVEPACGASIAAFYSGMIKRLQDEGRLPATLESILLIVCGGVGVTYDILTGWKTTFGVV